MMIVEAFFDHTTMNDGSKSMMSRSLHLGRSMMGRTISTLFEISFYRTSSLNLVSIEPRVLRNMVLELRTHVNRPLEKTMALDAIMRHLEATVVISHLYDFQLALESWTAKMNVNKPSRNLFGDNAELPNFTVFETEKELPACVYPESKGVKKKMYMHEIPLFSDGTLKAVLKELKKRLQFHKMTFILMDDKFVEAIEERLRIRGGIPIFLKK